MSSSPIRLGSEGDNARDFIEREGEGDDVEAARLAADTQPLPFDPARSFGGAASQLMSSVRDLKKMSILYTTSLFSSFSTLGPHAGRGSLVRRLSRQHFALAILSSHLRRLLARAP